MKTLGPKEQDDIIRMGVRKDLSKEGIFSSCYLKEMKMKIIKDHWSAFQGESKQETHSWHGFRVCEEQEGSHHA